jgi:hypothetical protein
MSKTGKDRSSFLVAMLGVRMAAREGTGVRGAGGRREKFVFICLPNLSIVAIVAILAIEESVSCVFSVLPFVVP